MLPNDQLADGGPSVTRELPDSVAGPHHSVQRLVNSRVSLRVNSSLISHVLFAETYSTQGLATCSASQKISGPVSPGQS